MATEKDSTSSKEELHGFPPIIGEEPRVLILGSMPGVRSLELQQYYGHPQNHFWRIICTLLDLPLPQEYQKRTAVLREAGIALWDSIDSCRREGSLDQAIREEQPNDVVGLLRRRPSIRLVVFNGRKAEQGFYRGMRSLYGGEVPDVMQRCSFIRLPSSSPIPTKGHKKWQDKLAEWRVILEYLNQ